MRAVAWSAIFLIVAVFLSILTTVVIFWKWLGSSKQQASQLACQVKFRNYCSELIAGKNPNWNDIPPKTGCEQYGFSAPPSLEDCKKAGFG